MEKLAVIGDPISHSISPKMHNFWLERSGIVGSYEAVKVTKENLRDFLENLVVNGYKGINITVPHKEEAYKIVNEIGEIRGEAKKIKAINTIKIENGKLVGYNTDAMGFIKSVYVQNEQFSFSAKRVLLIGAGGAARAIIAGLQTENAAEITIVNRSKEKADNLKKEFLLTGKVGEISDIENLLENIDVVINTSSMGLNDENNLMVDWSKSKNKLTCIDIVYKPLITKFLSSAKEAGMEIITGKEMLIQQGAIAFNIWLDVEVDTKGMISWL